jgi:hypothetical protein
VVAPVILAMVIFNFVRTVPCEVMFSIIWPMFFLYQSKRYYSTEPTAFLHFSKTALFWLGHIVSMIESLAQRALPVKSASAYNFLMVAFLVN